MQLRLNVSIAGLLGLVLALSLFESVGAGLSTGNIISQFMPETTSAKELKNNFKVMLTKLKLRQVPLAKKRSERELSHLYMEERRLKNEIEELEIILSRIRGHSGREPLQMLKSEVPISSAEIYASRRSTSPTTKISALTADRQKEMTASLNQKRDQLNTVKNKIVRGEKIVKDPESFISVPSDYGRDPEEQRELEKELLIKDRLNIEFRSKIKLGEIVPAWLTDNF